MVYKFWCAGCAPCYVGETTQHYNTRVREHLGLTFSNTWRARQHVAFAIIDRASSRFALKIKEALHKPTLNAQVKQVNLKLSGFVPQSWT